MHLPPPPSSRELLPPLLACLPTAFMSPRPPPALMPILSPLLRQRMNFMSSTPGTNGWLPLLTWDQERAAKLPDVVERMQFEAHPVSGEIEMDDVRPAKYRRLDDETLHSKMEVEQFDLCPLFVWCEDDQHGETGAGWKLAELRSLEDAEDGERWFDTPSEANDAVSTRSFAVPETNRESTGHSHFVIPADDEDDDDGSYWAAYDNVARETPGATPGQKRSPAPPAGGDPNRQRTHSELEYFNRYGSVQPAMDGHDPDEDHEGIGQSTLNGRSNLMQDKPTHPQPHDSAVASVRAQSLQIPAEQQQELSMPRPISPTSSQGSVDRLEERAAAMSTTDVSTERAQRSIKQHISTDIKSLFRLAKGVGMERSEFEEVVRRELDVLSMLDRDE